jgi:putative ABC transport system permease protein
MLSEAQLALRRISQKPIAYMSALAALTLGIAAVIAVSSLLLGVLVRPLPFAVADRLVVVEHTAPGLGIDRAPLSAASYLRLRGRRATLEDSGHYYETRVNLVGDENAERLAAAMVSPSLFSTLGVRPLLGRSFMPSDCIEGATPVVILSHDLWQRRYGADQNLVGRAVEINGRLREVVGVLPAEVRFPKPETKLWFPDEVAPDSVDFSEFTINAVARLARGRAPEAARRELAGALEAVMQQPNLGAAGFLEESKLGLVLRPLREHILGDVGGVLWPIWGAVIILWLLVCATCANLLLLGYEERSHEIAVRHMLGAGWKQTLRTCLSEALLLSVVAGAAGLSLASLLVHLLVHKDPFRLPRLQEVSLEADVAGLAIGAVIVSGLLVGLLPALKISFSQRRLTHAVNANFARRLRRTRTREVVLVAQLALTLSLMVLAGLLVRTAANLSRAELGFRAEGLLSFDIALPFRGYPDHASAQEFYATLLRNVEALPGVERAAIVSTLPLTAATATDPVSSFKLEGSSEPALRAKIKLVSARYFEVMGIEVTGSGDMSAGQGVEERAILVDRTARARLLSSGSADGRELLRLNPENPGAPPIRLGVITGTAAAVKERAVSQPPEPTIYVSALSEPVLSDLVPRVMTVVVASKTAPEPLAPPLRKLVAELNPSVPLSNLQKVSVVVADSTARTRFSMVLLVAAALSALLLSLIGLYSACSELVYRRLQELSVRRALGAGAREILRTVAGRSVVLIALGLGVGLILAMVSSRYVETLLFGVAVTDVPTVLGSCALLLLAAVFALIAPLRRALAVEPVRLMAGSRSSGLET